MLLLTEDKTQIKGWLMSMAGLDGIKDIEELSKSQYSFIKTLKL